MSDVPVTPVYGLPHERGVTLPGRTLTGGPTGEDPTLAEAVEAELQRDDGDVAGLRAEVARGAAPIASGGEAVVSVFTVDVTADGRYPAGTFSLMRLHLRGQMVSDAQWLSLNINNRLDADTHRRGWLQFRASDGTVTDSGMGDATTWRIGYWSGQLVGNTCTVELFETGIASFVSFRSTAEYQSGASSTFYRTECWGRLNENRLVSSLRVGRVGSSNISSCRWWLEGWRN